MRAVRTVAKNWKLVTVGLVVVLLLVGALTTIDWFQSHIFNLSIEDEKPKHNDRAALLEKIKAFELVTAKYKVNAEADVDIRQHVRIGPFDWRPPGMITSNSLRSSADVRVDSKIDLDKVQEGDITERTENGQRIVTIMIPPAEVGAIDVDESTFRVNTSDGILQKLGIKKKDLQDESLGLLKENAKTRAVGDGLLKDANTQAREKLAAFLNSLPVGDGGGATYEVVTRTPDQ